jgi:APA family basic amino acid/polyamine antiporter
LAGFLEACALMFVAYTGYGRIATLGEEIREPYRNIPVAIGVTLVISTALYIAVAFVAIGAVGAESLAAATLKEAAPLEIVARQFGRPLVPAVVALGAVTAMLGVLLNLIVGLSRVVLAMARRRDLPEVFSRLDSAGASPIPATLLVGGVVTALVLIGNVKTTWSFSAFTVLVYYALTNVCALRLSPAERLYPAFIPWIGLAACLFLAAWVEALAWMTGLGLIAAGLAWHRMAVRLRQRSDGPV